MSSDESKPTADAAPAPNKLKPIGMIAASSIAGIVAGYFILGPKFAGASPAPAATEAESNEGHGEEEDTGHGESKLVRVDNIVVNPAGSEGLRFLMVSVAFEVRDAAALATLQGSEIQVRDAVTGVFERQTMAQLTKPGARDSLRLDLAGAIHPIIGSAKVRVYLPQFVIQ